ncbi:hypothetical protein GCM10027217_18600 [Pseudomaricurvus hydrocarbonicus]
MQLITWSTINRRYFARGQGPSKAEWTTAVLQGEINGKIWPGQNKVYIDLDDFLSRDQFTAANDPHAPKMDLLD